MDIADQLQQVGFLVADDRLVTGLEEVTGPMVSKVEADRVAGQQSPHQHGKLEASGQNQKVENVGNRRPGVAEGFGIFEQLGKAADEVLPVSVIEEDLFSHSIGR